MGGATKEKKCFLEEMDGESRFTFIAVWLWASYWVSRSFYFLIEKVGIKQGMYIWGSLWKWSEIIHIKYLAECLQLCTYVLSNWEPFKHSYMSMWLYTHIHNQAHTYMLLHVYTHTHAGIYFIHTCIHITHTAHINTHMHILIDNGGIIGYSMNSNDQIRVYLKLFLPFFPSLHTPFLTHCHYYLNVGNHPL